MTSPLAAWALVLNAFVWGVSWLPFRRMDEAGLHPLWATFIIYALACVALLLWRPQSWRLILGHRWLWLLLVAAGLTNVGFNWAVTVGDVVRVVLLFYLMPVWSMGLAWLLLGEKPGRSAVLRLALSLTGLFVVLKTPESPWPLPVDLADWLALAGGMCFALTNVLLRKLNDTPDEARMVAMFGGGALMALGAAIVAQGIGLAQLPSAMVSGWLPWALLMAVGFLVANLGLQYGAARLPAATTALIMLTEVVFASVSSVWLGAAELQARTLMGGALILLAALWASWPQRAARST